MKKIPSVIFYGFICVQIVICIGAAVVWKMNVGAGTSKIWHRDVRWPRRTEIWAGHGLFLIQHGVYIHGGGMYLIDWQKGQFLCQKSVQGAKVDWIICFPCWSIVVGSIFLIAMVWSLRQLRKYRVGRGFSPLIIDVDVISNETS